MNKKWKNRGFHLLCSLCGIFIGTGISIFIAPEKIKLHSYFTSVILSPFELTFGFPMVFSSLSEFIPFYIKIMVLIGMFLWCVSIYYGKNDKHKRALILAFIGTLLWSLSNITIFLAFMSV